MATVQPEISSISGDLAYSAEHFFSGNNEQPKWVETSRMADDLEEYDDDSDYEEEKLECSGNYLLACIMLPFLDGNLTGFAWPGYTLHYAEMGWPAVNAGLSVTVGYAMRVAFQQMMRMAGFWIAIPFAMIHLAIALLAFFFPTSEPAVFLEVVAFICFQPTAVIEGIAFDTFGSSETLARQATSTVLSVFTLSKAVACTLGGIVYDAFGWKGVAMYHVTWCVPRFLHVFTFCNLLLLHFSIHLVNLVPLAKGYAIHDGEIAFNESCLRLGTTKVIMQGGLLAIFFIQPSCRKSFMLVFFPGAVEEEREAVEEESKAVEDKVDDEGAAFEQVMPSQPTQKSPASSPAAMRTSNLESPKRLRSGSCDDHMEVVDVEAMADLKRQSREAPQAAVDGVNPARKSRASRRATRRSGMSQKSQATRKTAHTRGSGGTMHTMRSIGTALTKMTSLSQAGEGLQHACGMEPTIISAKGGLGVARNDAKNDWFDAYGEVEEIDGPKSEAQDSAKAKRGIPKDLRLPACLILSSCLCNTVGCVTIYSRFAIFFKEVHDFNATFAGMAQTAGDITAATVIKVVPFLFSADLTPWKQDASNGIGISSHLSRTM